MAVNLQSRTFGSKNFLLMWPLFFAICFGLGYPALQRYDPRLSEGMSDSWKYYKITTGEDTSAFNEIFRCRLLVPYVARPFYWFAKSYLPVRNAGFFGLLMANALFCATSASLIASIGNRLIDDPGTALFGAALYLLSFTVPNLQLAGLIDTGEACFLTALTWSLLTGKWYLLPIWGFLGALAKETFVPFSVVFAFTWWLIERRRTNTQSSQLKWVVALGVVGLATVLAVHTAVSGTFKWPWSIAGQARARVNFFVALWHCLTERSFWYLFGWLIPLGVWRLEVFPKAWRVAAISTSILAIMLGAYSNAGGTVGRATFNIIGPLLSLSVAVLIARPFARKSLTARDRG